MLYDVALTPYNILILFYVQKVPYDSIGAVLVVNVPLHKKNLR